jgi:hypothetical protein
MHYKNGREAKNGDTILILPKVGETYPTPAVGVLFGAKGDSNDCNGSIAPILSGGQVCVADLKNCLHLDDIAAAIIPDSTKTT